MIKRLSLVFLFFCFMMITTVHAQSLNTSGSSATPIHLWVNNRGNDSLKEKDVTKPTDNIVAGKPVIRLGNVTDPTITVFMPKLKTSNTAVIVCPGGGYSILAMDLEGTEICNWFNSLGITAVLLKYRVPAKQGALSYAAPLEDVQRALSLTRFHANDWKIDLNKIGILGFSAGGHLSALASTNYNKRSYAPSDEADSRSCRPDFTLLIYPAYLAEKANTSVVAAELPVTDQTPPTFIMQTEDDPVGVEGALTYFLALKKAKVPAEIHVYAKGGHGYGLRNKEGNYSSWPSRAEEWLREIKVLGN